MKSYLTQAAEFVEKTTLADLPPEVVLDGKRSLMDTLGCIVGGSAREPIARMAALYGSVSPNRTSSILGRREKLDPLFAALVNGTAAVWLDYDSGHRHPSADPPVPAIHPPVHIVPAALAVGEQLGASGNLLLESYIASYEINARTGIASKLRPGLHVFGTQNVMGAAMAVAKLRGYDAARIAEVVNIASSMTLATSMQAAIEGATVRNVYCGLGAFNGVLANHLFECGITGESDGIASVFGKVSATDFNPLMMIADLGVDFESTKGYYKIHACCRWNHPPLDALEAILQRQRFTAAEVEEIEVQTFQFATFIAGKEPTSELGAKFSLPHALAARIVLETSGPHAFDDDALASPEVRELAQRVEIVENREFSTMLPTYRPTRVTVRFRDGTSASEMVWGALGDPQRRFPPEWLERKFLGLCTEVLGPQKASKALEMVLNIDELPDVRELTGVLTVD